MNNRRQIPPGLSYKARLDKVAGSCKRIRPKFDLSPEGTEDESCNCSNTCLIMTKSQEPYKAKASRRSFGTFRTTQTDRHGA